MRVFLLGAIQAWQRTLTSGKVEEVVTGERYCTIELLEYDAAARRFVPVITSPAAVTGDPRRSTVDLIQSLQTARYEQSKIQRMQEGT